MILLYCNTLYTYCERKPINNSGITLITEQIKDITTQQRSLFNNVVKAKENKHIFFCLLNIKQFVINFVLS